MSTETAPGPPPPKETKRTWHRVDSPVGLSRADVINGMVGVLFGGIVGWAISKVADDPNELQLWVVIAVAIVACVVCIAVTSFLGAFQAEGRERLDEVDSQVDALLREVNRVGATVDTGIAQVQEIITKGVDASAVLVPRESIYFEMATCIRGAQKQVVVLTTFMYDWENDRRTFNPVVQGETPGVGEFYDAIYGCIERSGVEYVRIWQVPSDHVADAPSKIKSEERLRKEIDLIEKLSPDDPHSCRLRIIPVSTTASMVLVDQETLFFNVDFFDSERKVWLSPFMLMIRDARGRAFQDMQRIITKLSTQA